jgi:hypothetical protein
MDCFSSLLFSVTPVLDDASHGGRQVRHVRGQCQVARHQDQAAIRRRVGFIIIIGNLSRLQAAAGKRWMLLQPTPFGTAKQATSKNTLFKNHLLR